MGTVTRIPTDRADLYAFEIDGEVTSAAMESMSETMNAAFDAHPEKIDMLLVFREFAGSETGATLDGDVIASRFRALTNVARYVVVGAPGAAETMIEAMSKVMPVEAHTFPLAELDAAWTLLGARPAAPGAVGTGGAGGAAV